MANVFTAMIFVAIVTNVFTEFATYSPNFAVTNVKANFKLRAVGALTTSTFIASVSLFAQKFEVMDMPKPAVGTLMVIINLDCIAVVADVALEIISFNLLVT